MRISSQSVEKLNRSYAAKYNPAAVSPMCLVNHSSVNTVYYLPEQDGHSLSKSPGNSTVTGCQHFTRRQTLVSGHQQTKQNILSLLTSTR